MNLDEVRRGTLVVDHELETESEGFKPRLRARHEYLRRIRVEASGPEAPFDIDDVAAGIVAKLVRRHPHVFAGGSASTPGEVETSWEAIKAAEKAAALDGPVGSDPLRGVPAGMPPLARATKVASRLRKAGLDDLLTEAATGDEPGARLLALVAELTADGVDPDTALRGALRGLVERVAPPPEPA